jgi:ribosomal protein S14
LAFDFNPLLTLPKERAAKRKKKRRCLSPQGEFLRFPLCRALFREPEGQRQCGRLLLLTFLGETRKVSGCRAAPGMSLRRTTGIKRRTLLDSRFRGNDRSYMRLQLHDKETLKHQRKTDHPRGTTWT